VQEGTIKRAKDCAGLAKADRFVNHIFFKRNNSLYIFGEHFLHVYDLKRNLWSDEDYVALNQNSIN
jgi:hypothetical protein